MKMIFWDDKAVRDEEKVRRLVVYNAHIFKNTQQSKKKNDLLFN
jgi:hypothetical protein